MNAHADESNSGEEGADDYEVEEVELELDEVDPEVIGPIVEREQRKGTIGLIGGLLIILLGLAMVFGGVTGSVDLLIRSGGNQLHVQTAVVGVVVGIVGAVVIYITRPKVTIRQGKQTGGKKANGTRRKRK